MSKTLLVVDDAMIIREMIKDAARESDWEIAGEAANGQEAIDQFRRLRPSAVTLDLVMPDFDGLHALSGIMAIDPAAQVLVVSALDQTTILREAIQQGARDFIVKPFDRPRLTIALDRMLTSARTKPGHSETTTACGA